MGVLVVGIQQKSVWRVPSYSILASRSHLWWWQVIYLILCTPTKLLLWYLRHHSYITPLTYKALLQLLDKGCMISISQVLLGLVWHNISSKTLCYVFSFELSCFWQDWLCGNCEIRSVGVQHPSCLRLGWCWDQTEVYCRLACSFSCIWASLADMHGRRPFNRCWTFS